MTTLNEAAGVQREVEQGLRHSWWMIAFFTWAPLLVSLAITIPVLALTHWLSVDRFMAGVTVGIVYIITSDAVRKWAAPLAEDWREGRNQLLTARSSMRGKGLWS